MSVGLYVAPGVTLFLRKSSPEVPAELRGADQEHPEPPHMCMCVCVCVCAYREMLFFTRVLVCHRSDTLFFHDEVELFDHKQLTTTMTKSRFLL